MQDVKLTFTWFLLGRKGYSVLVVFSISCFIDITLAFKGTVLFEEIIDGFVDDNFHSFWSWILNDGGYVTIALLPPLVLRI